MNATLSLAAVLAESARRRPDHPALIDGEQRITFAEMWRQAREQAAALIDLGIRPGQRVALMAPNTADFPRAYYAVLAAGATVVPVHLLLNADEVEYVLRDSGATLLLCHEQVAATGAAGAAQAGIRCLDPKTLTAAEPLQHYVSRSPLDTAVVFYTSGTTGRPKGAELSHLNMVMSATVNAVDANEVRADDIALGALPLFHIFGQTVSMNSCWRVGVTLVLLPRFTPAEAIRLMVAERVNTFHGVPTMFAGLLAAAAGEAALPELRLCISGGAALPPSVLEGFEETFGARVLEGYGLSETSPTAAVVDGWFRTGDLGTKDADGYVRIVDRIKEMIIRGGFNVYPTEVEAALLRHPNIDRVAVIGVPDEHYGEEILAVVVADGPLTADEVVDFGRAQVARYKYPRRVEFVDELPLGPTHKVLKRELRQRFARRADA